MLYMYIYIQFIYLSRHLWSAFWELSIDALHASELSWRCERVWWSCAVYQTLFRVLCFGRTRWIAVALVLPQFLITAGDYKLGKSAVIFFTCRLSIRQLPNLRMFKLRLSTLLIDVNHQATCELRFSGLSLITKRLIKSRGIHPPKHFAYNPLFPKNL